METITTPRKTVSTQMNGEGSPVRNVSTSEVWIITCDQHVKAKYPRNAKYAWSLTISFNPGFGPPVGTELSEQGISDIKSMLSQLHNLKKLEIDLPPNPNLTEYAMTELMEAISNLYNLDHLTIRTGNLLPACESGFRALSEALNTCSLLETLVLQFDNCEKTSKAFTKRNGAVLREGLMELKVLHNLELSFESSIALSDDFMIAVLEAIQHLPQLKNLKLDFSRSWGITNFSFYSFTQAGNNLRNLQSFTLILDECSDITNQGIKYFTTPFTKSPTLTDINFSFVAHTNVDDSTLVLIKKQFCNLRGMQALSLNISENKNVDLLGFLAIRDLLVNFGELKKLDLNFAKTPLSEQGFAGLCGALSVQTKLTDLSLDISSCIKMRETALVILKDCLACLKHIKHFKFGIENWDEELSEKGVSFLTKGFSYLKYAKSFEVNFSYCAKVGDDALKILKECFEVMKGLHELVLNFEECIDITKDGWSYLKEGLLKLTHLKRVVFNFARCQKLAEQFLYYVKEVLQNNKGLDQVELYANGCYQLGDKGIHSLKEGLFSLSKLSYCRIVYDDTHSPMMEGDKFRSILCRHMPQTTFNITVIHAPQSQVKFVEINSVF